ncbi:uncharacterized protein EI90DRAFT_3118868 [Cantharellus anzutake]|uniref:uncharacterized protein n=1 Tax=Cantharellus anzutake TaxID=1750568 RepID=UPI0019085825|nr:uncharacterized protein EI90DRAFT_3118868 [Cantharellus anzutake]KAF8337417.1 hypothetical protein EI90DRAFT_3118868 [Cantharellus anzutake]
MAEAIVSLQNGLNGDATVQLPEGPGNAVSNEVGGTLQAISDETLEKGLGSVSAADPEDTQSTAATIKVKAPVSTDAKTRTTPAAAKSATRPLPKSTATPGNKPAAGRPSIAPAPSSKTPASTAARKLLSSSVSAPPKTSTAIFATKAPPTTSTTTTSAVSRRLSTAPPSTSATKPPASRASVAPSSAKPPLRSSTAANTALKSATDVKPVAPSRDSPTLSVTGGKATPVSTDAGRKPAANRPTPTAPTAGSRHVIRPSVSAARATPPSVRDVKTPPTAKSELDAKVAESLKELDAKSGVIEGLRVELSDLQAKLEHATAQGVQQTAEFERLSTTVKGYTESNQTLVADIASLKAEFEASIAEAEKLKEQLQAAQTHAAATASEADRVRVELDEARKLLASASEQIRTLEDARSQGEAALVEAVAVRAELEVASKKHAAVLSEEAQKLADAQIRNAENERLIQNLRADLEKYQKDNAELTSKIDELNVEVLEANEVADKEVNGRQKEVALLKQQHWEEKDQLTKSLQEDIQRAASAHEAAAKKWEETLEATREKHTSDLAAALADAETKASAAREVALTTLTERHEARVKAQVEEQEKLLIAAKQNHEQEIASLNNTVDRLSKDLEAQQAKFDAQVREIRNQHDELLQKAFNDAKSEAAAAHAQELAAFRAQSQATHEQLQATHQNNIAELSASHKEILEEQTGALNKHIKELSVNLAATTDDLAKSKTHLASSEEDKAVLKEQVNEARNAVTTASASADAAAQEKLAQARREVESAIDDMNTYKKLLEDTQLSFASDTDAHTAAHARELEDIVSKHTQDITTLKDQHEQELAHHNAEKAELRHVLEDERDAKEKALAQIATFQQVRSPPSSPRHTPSKAGVSKEEIEKLHQAHNVTLMTLEAEHNKEMQALKDQVARLEELVNEVQGEKEHKELELVFATQEKGELEDDLKRQADELSQLKARVSDISASA